MIQTSFAVPVPTSRLIIPTWEIFGLGYIANYLQSFQYLIGCGGEINVNFVDQLNRWMIHFTIASLCCRQLENEPVPITLPLHQNRPRQVEPNRIRSDVYYSVCARERNRLITGRGMQWSRPLIKSALTWPRIFRLQYYAPQRRRQQRVNRSMIRRWLHGCCCNTRELHTYTYYVVLPTVV